MQAVNYKVNVLIAFIYVIDNNILLLFLIVEEHVLFHCHPQGLEYYIPDIEQTYFKAMNMIEHFPRFGMGGGIQRLP